MRKTNAHIAGRGGTGGPVHPGKSQVIWVSGPPEMLDPLLNLGN